MNEHDTSCLFEKAISEWLRCSSVELRELASFASIPIMINAEREGKYYDFLRRIDKIRKVAVVVFEGDEPAAASWMLSKQIGLDGELPIRLMFDDVGYKAVENLLDQIDRGIYP